MNDIIILVIAMGTVAVLVVKAFSLLSNEITRLHRDVRKVREYAFWSQRRGVKSLKILRKTPKIGVYLVKSRKTMSQNALKGL